jgi:O-antigen ligase
VTAYLGFLTAATVMLFISRTIRKSYLLILFTILFLLVSLGLVNNLFGLPADLGNIIQNFDIIPQALDRVQNITADLRLLIYRQVLDTMVESPFIGVGYDQLSTSNIERDQRFLEFSVHNGALQTLYVGGLIAFVGYLGLHIFLAWIAIRILWLNRNHGSLPLFSGVAIAILSILVMDQFQDAIYAREKWLVVGLLVGAYGLYFEKNKKDKLAESHRPEVKSSQQEHQPIHL